MSLTARTTVQIYKHVQDVPSTTWTIDHNLGDYPIVDVYVMYESVLQKIIPASVTYVTPNQCTVSFSTPYDGYATVV